MEEEFTTSFLHLPPEVLEEILKYISFREIGYVIKQVNRQFKEAAYNIFKKEFKNLAQRIEQQVKATTRELQLIQDGSSNMPPDQGFKAMTRYTLLKILHSEYRLLSLLWHKASSFCFTTTVIMGEILDEFNSLMRDSKEEDWSWKCRKYVTKEMVTLLNLNYRVSVFFYEMKNKYINRFGPHVLEILSCSIQSSYELSISYDSEDEDHSVSEDSWCNIDGFYEIKETSNTYSAPPSGLQDSDSQSLAHYLHDTIRWGNLIHSYKLRWNYMNQTIVQNCNKNSNFPFKDELQLCNQSITDVGIGRKRIYRKVKRKYNNGEQNEVYDYCFRCKFQIRCKVNEVSSDLLHINCKNLLMEHNNDVQEYWYSEHCSEPKEFKFTMELSVQVRPFRQPYDHKEYKIWVNENESTIKITNNMLHFD